MKKNSLLIWALLFTGCATHPVPTSQSPLVPSHRMLVTKWLLPSANTGKLIVKRDAGNSGAACQVQLMIDRAPVADLKPKEHVELYLPAGDYMLAVASHGLCAGGAISESTASIIPGQTHSYRITASVGGELSIQPTAF